MTVHEVVLALSHYPPELVVQVEAGSVTGVQQGKDGERTVVKLMVMPFAVPPIVETAKPVKPEVPPKKPGRTHR